MLGKLFKHEWIAISKLLVVIHGFILIFAILSRIFFEVSGGVIWQYPGRSMIS